MADKLPVNFTETANQRFKETNKFFMNWRAEARDDYAFISGDQWIESDKQYLDEQQRPAVTFNYSEKMIDAVVGAEVSNRQEVTYRPREVTDAAVSEVWNNAAKWIRDLCNAEDEETDSFHDALICGMGWTQTRMSYDDDLDGRVEIHRIDPLEMRSDPAATKPGVVDRRYNFRVWYIDERDAKREWPDVVSFPETESDRASGVIRQGHRYEGDEFDAPEMHKGQVQIRHYECFEREAVYRVEGAQGMIELNETEFRAAKSQLEEAGTRYVKQYKKVYYRAFFAGDTLLEGGKSPSQVGFTFNCITGKRDRNRNTWYGLTRVMKDPQRWANKWLSQILHIVNSNAKGGLLAETGAFVDPRKAQDEWAAPDSVTMLNEGGLLKVKEKQMSSYPSGLDRLMQFALSSLPMVTGINLEALGLANREQAGVLEQQRKQAAYGLLSPLFDSLRRYRKIQGRVLLGFIHDYISDGRMVRIGGQESQQFLPLTKTPGAMEYDVFVDQSPNAPDVKEKTWQTLSNLVPAMLKVNIPPPDNFLDYAPVPIALSQAWAKTIAESKQKQQGPSPEQVQQLQQQMQQMQQENEKLKQALADKSAEMQLKQTELQHDMQLSEAELKGKMALQEQELRAKLALQAQKQEADAAIKQEQVNAEIDARTHEIVQSGANEASSNINQAINKLVETITKVSNED